VLQASRPAVAARPKQVGLADSLIGTHRASCNERTLEQGLFRPKHYGQSVQAVVLIAIQTKSKKEFIILWPEKYSPESSNHFTLFIKR